VASFSDATAFIFGGRTMKKTWIWIIAAVLALGLLAAGMLYLYRNFAPQFRGVDQQPGKQTSDATADEAVAGKQITVTVVHKDGSSKEFTYETNEQYLGTVLKEAGLIQGEDGPYGLMISTVDGELADWNVDQGYWALYVGEEYAVTGIDMTPITDGGSYSLEYTIG
jgi:hypothetical protein